MENQRYHFADKGPPSQNNGFSSSHLRMWELNHNEGWALKNLYFWIEVLEKTLESSLDRKKSTLIIYWKYWCWSGSSNTLATWWEEPAHWKRCMLDAGKDWGREEKGTTEDEMVGWHHQLNGQEFEQTLGDSEGQGSLASCSPWGCKESDIT